MLLSAMCFCRIMSQLAEINVQSNTGTVCLLVYITVDVRLVVKFNCRFCLDIFFIVLFNYKLIS